MTPNLPQKLWRPLSEVKSYVEKFPDGVSLSALREKVSCYAALQKKDRIVLINHLEGRESILVVKDCSGNGRPKTTLRHKKYGYPKKEELEKKCPKCGEVKSKAEFYANTTKVDGKHSYCKQCCTRQSTERDWTKENYGKKTNNGGQDMTNTNTQQTQKLSMSTVVKTPAQLRKEAEELLKAAEDAENEARGNDIFNKKLAPVKLEVLQAVGAVQRKFDEIMDCVGTLEKAAQKLKDLTA